MTNKQKMKHMLSMLKQMCGENATGLLIAGLLDALQEATKGKDCIEVRSVKFVINDFFEYDVIRMKEAPSGL